MTWCHWLRQLASSKDLVSPPTFELLHFDRGLVRNHIDLLPSQYHVSVKTPYPYQFLGGSWCRPVLQLTPWQTPYCNDRPHELEQPTDQSRNFTAKKNYDTTSTSIVLKSYYSLSRITPSNSPQNSSKIRPIPNRDRISNLSKLQQNQPPPSPILLTASSTCS